MTRTTDTAKTTATTQNPMSRDDVKRMLRDAAFVLQMTRLVKADMMANRPETAEKCNTPKTPELAAGLGV